MIATEIILSEQQEAVLMEGQLLRIPASLEEFLDFLETTDYHVEYYNEEIIIMGLAKFLHEWLVIHVATMLSNLYKKKNYFVFGSNLGIHASETRNYHNADVVVTKGNPVFHGNSEAIITNPHLIVEILSGGTKRYDLNEKLDSYQTISSLQHIIYVEPDLKYVKTISRTDNPKSWLQTICNQSQDVVMVDGLSLPLIDFFENMPVMTKEE